MLTLDVPRDVAVQRPDARVVGGEAQHDVVEGRHRDGVAAHRVLQVPRRGAAGLAEGALAPAYDLERVAAVGGQVRLILCVGDQLPSRMGRLDQRERGEERTVSATGAPWRPAS